MIDRPWGLQLRGTPSRASSSKYTICCTGVALRPPYSGGQPGTSQPLSKSLRCQARAHSGMWAEDRTRSARSEEGGRFASIQARNSRRNASVCSS